MNEKFKEQPKLSAFLIIAILSVLFALIKLSLGITFWVVLLIWIIIYLIFFVKPYAIVYGYFWIILLIAFSISIAFSINLIKFESDDAQSNNSSNQIVLADCTSKSSDQPVMINGWKSTIYSATLSSNTPSINESNNVRTFSYDGIKNKTESNSLYARIEKNDSSDMAGYTTAMELCNTNNKAVKSYTTTQSTRAIGSGISASEHVLHKGLYVFESGDYRADIYVKTTDGKWHLVDRMANINITE